EVVEQIRRTHGLDQPLPMQYVRYVSGLLKGDLGRSIRTGRPVAEDLARFFPATLELVVTALTLAVVVGVPLGVWSASRQNTWVDHISRGVSVAGVSMPLFWLGVVALTVLYGRPGWQNNGIDTPDRKSTRLNSSHVKISYAVFRLKKDTL